MSDGTVTIDTKLDNSGFKSGVDRLTSSARGLASSLGAAFAGISFGAIVKKISDVGVSFQAEMSRVKAISGATAEEFKALSDKAKELGASTQYSASEVAQGMENLASAGFSTNEILAAMPGMLNLAASAGESLATSSDIAASTLRGFGLEASQAGHVADVLARNAADTNAAVADTGEAMKYVAPVAHAMGLSLEEVTASIGLMANAGIKGSQAGTVLRSALTRLASPSKEAAKAMENIGFNAFDSQGKLLPLTSIIQNLKTATAGLTDEQKQNALATIFGQESLSGMLALVDAGPSQLDELTNSLKNSDGAAQEMADTMTNNVWGATKALESALEGLGIAIFEKFSERSQNTIQLFTEVISNVTQALQNGDLDGTIDKITAAVELATTAFIAFKTQAMIGSVITSFQSALAVVNEVKAAQEACAVGSALLGSQLKINELIVGLLAGKMSIAEVATTLWTKAQLLLNAAWSANPIGLIVGAIVALVAVIVIAYNHCETFRNIVNACWEGIKEATVTILGAVVNFFTETLPGAIKSVINFLEPVIDFVKNNWQNILLFLVNPFVGGFRLLYDNCETFRQFIDEFVNSIINFFTSTIPNAVSSIASMIYNSAVNAFNGLKDFLNSAFPGLFEGLSTELQGVIQIIESIFSGIKNIALDFINILKDLFTGNFKGLKEDFLNLFSDIGETLGGIVEGIIQIIKGKITAFFAIIDTIGYYLAYLVGLVTSAVIAIYQFVTVQVPLIIDSIVEWVAALPGRIWAWLVNAVAYVQTWGQNTYDTATQWISNTIDSVINWFSQLPERIWSWLVNTIQKIIAWGSETYQAATTAANNAINAVVNWFSQLPGRIWTWLVNAVNAVASWGSNLAVAGYNAARSLFNTITSTIAGLPSKMYSIGSDIVRGIWNGITGAGGWLKDKISGFADSIVSGFKAGLGIHSPSRVMRDMVGKFIPRGIAVGIDAEMPNVQEQIDNNIQDLYSQLRGTVDVETARTTAQIVTTGNIVTSENSTAEKTTSSVGSTVNKYYVSGKEFMEVLAPYADQVMEEWRDGR